MFYILCVDNTIPVFKSCNHEDHVQQYLMLIKYVLWIVSVVLYVVYFVFSWFLLPLAKFIFFFLDNEVSFSLIIFKLSHQIKKIMFLCILSIYIDHLRFAHVKDFGTKSFAFSLKIITWLCMCVEVQGITLDPEHC